MPAASSGIPRPAGRLRRCYLSVLGALVVGAVLVGCDERSQVYEESGSPYVEGPASEEGIGKFYLGREIAQVAGHHDAARQDRPDRALEELPGRVIQAMPLDSADVIADIGAGTGYFTLRLAREVPAGRVYAVDIQPEMLDMIQERAAARGLDNVVPTLGTVTDPGLSPQTLDAALIVDAYHEFSHPREMVRGLVEALKPGGRLYLVEYRAEDPTVPVGPLHRMTEVQARREMEAAGLVWRETLDILPQQHFMVFERPAEDG